MYLQVTRRGLVYHTSAPVWDLRLGKGLNQQISINEGGGLGAPHKQGTAHYREQFLSGSWNRVKGWGFCSKTWELQSIIKQGIWVPGRSVHQLKVSCSVKESQSDVELDAERKELGIYRNLPRSLKIARKTATAKRAPQVPNLCVLSRNAIRSLFTLDPGTDTLSIKRIQPSKFEDLVGFFSWFMNQAASHPASRKELQGTPERERLLKPERGWDKEVVNRK